jgi:hypothetical protein
MQTLAFASPLALPACRWTPAAVATAPARPSAAFARAAAPSRRARGAPRMAAGGDAADGEPDVREVPFEIRGFSLANVGLGLGAGITLLSFSSYFTSVGQASASSLGFVYGVPILLIGCALKYAELQPVPLASTAEARALREGGGATQTQTKIVRDVTRHRYGDEAHLSGVMAALGLVPRGAACPELLRVREDVVGGRYVLGLEFYSVETPFKQWVDRVERMDRFFGPGVCCEVKKLDAEKRLVELRITATQGKEAAVA